MNSIASPSVWARAKALLGLFFLLLLATACSEKAPQFKSIDLTGADYAKNFSLPDVNGQTKTLADFQGKAVVLFFGFAQCPDVCPSTMAEVAAAKKLLGKDGDKVTAIFVTIDPERDTPQVLKAYMESFDPSFSALRGSEAQVAALAKDAAGDENVVVVGVLADVDAVLAAGGVVQRHPFSRVAWLREGNTKALWFVTGSDIDGLRAKDAALLCRHDTLNAAAWEQLDDHARESVVALAALGHYRAIAPKKPRTPRNPR